MEVIANGRSKISVLAPTKSAMGHCSYNKIACPYLIVFLSESLRVYVCGLFRKHLNMCQGYDPLRCRECMEVQEEEGDVAQ